MFKLLINSYTCCPGMGSEQGMGWNWIIALALHCECFVITEGEYRPQIERWLEDEANISLAKNMHFYWNPVPQSTREKCWNQGNWTFYPLYRKWQKKTAEIARTICKEHEIDILHQLNMIGFREPGYLWKVSKETGIPFVWGPIGGLKMFPMEYAESWKMKFFHWMKNSITVSQIKYSPRVIKAINQASVLVSSIPDSNHALKCYHNADSVIIPETGCFVNIQNDNITKNRQIKDNRFLQPTLTVLWVGKFDFRKRLDIAIKSIALSANKNVKLKIYGTGNPNQLKEAKSLVKKMRIEDSVEFMGNQPNDVVKAEMRMADVFLFTSVSEETSTVVMEAISNQLPVLCFDCCGMAAVIDEKVGVKIPLSNPLQSIKDFADALNKLYLERDLLVQMSKNCIGRANELSWENKAMKMIEIYKDALSIPSHTRDYLM